MLLVGGVPEIYFDRFSTRAANEIQHEFTGLPLRKNSSGSYVVTYSYCEELLETLMRYIEGRQSALESGLCVLLALRPWEQDIFYDIFRPFSLYRSLSIGADLIQTGTGARVSANLYADSLTSVARSSLKALRAINIEFMQRLRRTPILLPERHFNASELSGMLDHLGRNLATSPDPAEVIQLECKKFEQKYAFEKIGKRQGKFTNNNKIDFVSPGRADMHGCRAKVAAPPHTVRCFLNAHLRSGGAYQDGFHYDCTKDGKSYSGNFPNCHDDDSNNKGNPHMNVYPNDFIRT
ncbi:hypothetical protein [Methylobacterium currus]|uniref:hypothetical protein n=1 Tax=Methylobacterium currus TaxID=2051553 RepID=UPI000F4EBEFA|nr:hypothetical protein [Methylobacterium currus]